MTDRRRYRRSPIRYVALRAPARGEVLDMSPGGMRVETTEALAVGSRGWFSIGAEQHTVRLRGMVCWCRLRGTRATDNGEVLPIYLGGIVFLGLDGEPALPPGQLPGSK